MDKCQSFFQVLQKRAHFEWDQEADDAFQSLNVYIAYLPKIAILVLEEPLLLYLVVTEQAIIIILIAERDKEQIPIYYIHHALTGTELNYPLAEKFTYTLVLASQKLCLYFKAHKVMVLTN